MDATASALAPNADAADSEAASEKPFALPLREFIALEREQREPMLADADGHAAVGFLSLVLLGALGGHGKTTWSVDLFLHMAAGVDYPPFTVLRPVSILLIENEGPEQLFADKLEARLEHFPHELRAPLDVCTFDWGGFSLADNIHRERLIREIAEKGYDLVFGDPLDSLGIEGVGSPEDTRKFLALMKQAGLNKTVAWWLNTHPRGEPVAHPSPARHAHDRQPGTGGRCRARQPTCTRRASSARASARRSRRWRWFSTTEGHTQPRPRPDDGEAPARGHAPNSTRRPPSTFSPCIASSPPPTGSPCSCSTRPG